MLIASQKPNASYVAGFRTWNELGRFVKKGEKGILILAPMVRRKPENEEEIREDVSAPIAGFPAAYVFDVSQTDASLTDDHGKETCHGSGQPDPGNRDGMWVLMSGGESGYWHWQCTHVRVHPNVSYTLVIRVTSAAQRTRRLS